MAEQLENFQGKGSKSRKIKFCAILGHLRALAFFKKSSYYPKKGHFN